MIYDYNCDTCDIPFDVVKSMHDSSRPEICPKCGQTGRRIYSSKIYFTGTSVEDAEYNIGLGKITKSKRHRDELAKNMGLIEVGNEDPNKLTEQLEKNRIDEHKKGWEQL